MEAFYKEQGFFKDDAEFKAFMASLRTPLAATFRITGNRSEAQEFLKMMKARFFDKFKVMTHEGETFHPPHPLPFYPDNLAWYVDWLVCGVVMGMGDGGACVL
jgi:hypothetical protein